ncbi:YD repeat protein [Reticulomyxa filosa]|uniref:YD repeat protein n=1 Tax=Reticulomyxa filosa TaxID=46433 RepID=X6LXJ1_RETFI|nr:YD repeat protein [Reticulomyxa filosa]|eukprot:ETO05852.1 YD repeat protein [Reticulomyxa filosa]
MKGFNIYKRNRRTQQKVLDFLSILSIQAVYNGLFVVYITEYYFICLQQQLNKIFNATTTSQTTDLKSWTKGQANQTFFLFAKIYLNNKYYLDIQFSSVKRYGETCESTIEETIGRAQDIGRRIGKVRKRKGPKRIIGQPNCFVGGTEILVSKSGKHKKIEEMKVGDAIICLVPTHGAFHESVDCDIKDIPKHLTDAVVTAVHKSLTFHIYSHPLYVYKEGWKNVSGVAKQQYTFEIGTLKVGDALCLQSGHLAYITHIHRTCLKDPVTVFNLTASKGHTFFANHIFVHNKCVIL